MSLIHVWSLFEFGPENREVFAFIFFMVYVWKSNIHYTLYAYTAEFYGHVSTVLYLISSAGAIGTDDLGSAVSSTPLTPVKKCQLQPRPTNSVEFEAIFKNTFFFESGSQLGLFDGKNWGRESPDTVTV
jgi:hypothetical protein